jgi:hypothetical protein
VEDEVREAMANGGIYVVVAPADEARELKVLNGAYHVREASPEICCLLLGSLGLSGCEEFLCCVELTGMVPELFLFPAH